MTLLALLVLAAGPAVPVAGAKHTLSITDTRTLAGMVGSYKADMDAVPQVGKATVAFTVVAVDGARPSQLELSVTSGNEGLKGRAFTAEILSGDLVMRDTKGAPRGLQIEATKLFKPFVAELLREDPIIAASRSGTDPCSADVRARVLDAVAHEVHRLYGSNVDFELAPGGDAVCGKKKTAEKYDVKFTLTLRAGDSPAPFAFKGSVELGARAWHANLDLSGTAKFEMAGFNAKAKMTATFTLKSTVK